MISKRKDKGKTVKEIKKFEAAYRRVGRKDKQYRCIEISMQLVLTEDKTEPSGFEGTLMLIDDVSSRAIAALAEEFLPE